MIFLTLDPRLSACAEFVSVSSVVCDVGTDHAFLPVYLVKMGVCERAVASDIGKGPLKAAENTIEKHGLSEKIETVLSDGLKNVSRDGITHIVIAGMGGETILSILSECDWAKDCVLVLQPMTKHELLRKWLYENGFEITAERCVLHDKFAYTVMKCVFCGNTKTPTDLETVVGGLDLSDSAAREYIGRKAQSLEKSAVGKLRSDSRVAEGQRELELSEALKKLIDS